MLSHDAPGPRCCTQYAQLSATKGTETALGLLAGPAVFAGLLSFAKASVYESKHGPPYYPDGVTGASVDVDRGGQELRLDASLACQHHHVSLVDLVPVA